MTDAVSSLSLHMDYSTSKVYINGSSVGSFVTYVRITHVTRGPRSREWG
jgi:hypothetical protein